MEIVFYITVAAYLLENTLFETTNYKLLYFKYSLTKYIFVCWYVAENTLREAFKVGREKRDFKKKYNEKLKKKQKNGAG